MCFAQKKLIPLIVLSIVFSLSVTAQEKANSPSLKLQKAGFTKLTISWDSIDGAKSYKVSRNDKPLATISKTSYTDSGLQPGTEYTYQVKPANNDPSRELSLTAKTLAPMPFDSFELVQQAVDYFHESKLESATMIKSITTKIPGFKSFSTMDVGILQKMINAEYENFKEPTPELTPEEEATAKAEIQQILKEFGGHSFLVFYMHYKLIELADQHQAEGKYAAAEILFEAALKLINNVDNITFTTLASLARMKIAVLNENSSREDIIAAVKASQEYYLRFFTYFPKSNSTWAVQAYACAMYAHFRYFPKILSYDKYDQSFFDSALALAESSRKIADQDDVLARNRVDRITAWVPGNMTISVMKTDGNASSVKLIVKNVSNNLPNYVFYDDSSADDRSFSPNGNPLKIPVYKGHLYEIVAQYDVEGGAPIKYAFPALKYQQGTKIMFYQQKEPVIQNLPSGNNDPELVFVVSRPTMPYNLKVERIQDSSTLYWDWVKPNTDYQFKCFKIFRDGTEVGTVDDQSKTNFLLELTDSIANYTVRAYDVNDAPSPESQSVKVLPVIKEEAVSGPDGNVAVGGKDSENNLPTISASGASPAFKSKKDTRPNIAVASSNSEQQVTPEPKKEEFDAKSPETKTMLIDAAGIGDLAMVKMLINKGVDANTQDNNGNSILLKAAKEKHWDVVRFLLEKDAEPKAKDNNGRTIFSMAAADGKLDILEKIIGQFDSTDDKNAALNEAAGNGKEAIVKFLLSNGADVKFQDPQGFTALMMAAKSGNVEIVKLLLEKGADRNLKNADGKTAIDLAGKQDVSMLLNVHSQQLVEAVKKGDFNAVQTALKNGASIEAVNNKGTPVIIMAAQKGNSRLVKLIIDSKASVDAKDSLNFTALMWASARSHLETVKLLLKSGANPNLKNSAGESALSLTTETELQGVISQAIKDYKNSPDAE